MPTPEIALNARGPGILDGRQVRAMAFVPAREQMLDRIITERQLTAGTALVIGGGYSPLATSLRDRGFCTTSIDPSPEATSLAMNDAEADSGDTQRDAPPISFRTAPPTDLGVAPASFDLIYCADTLEVTSDAAPVLDSIADAARPGATIVLDTVADTAIAKLIYLVAFQRLPFTRIMPGGRYAASGLRSPAELERLARAAGIEIDSVIGFEPASVGSLVRAVLDRRSARIRDDDLPRAAGFHLSDGDHAPPVTYFAVGTAGAAG